MLLEHEIEFYDLVQNLPAFDENADYGEFLFVHEINAEDVTNTPEKARVSIGGIVKQVNYFRRQYH